MLVPRLATLFRCSAALLTLLATAAYAQQAQRSVGQESRPDPANAADAYLEAAKALEVADRAEEANSKKDADQKRERLNLDGDPGEIAGPEWVEYIQSRGDAIAAFERAASEPRCSFDLRYSRQGLEPAYEIAQLLRVGFLIELRASNAVRAGDKQTALRDLNTILRASRHLGSQGSRIAHFIALRMEAGGYRLASRTLAALPTDDVLGVQDIERSLSLCLQQPIDFTAGYQASIHESRLEANFLLRNLPKELSERMANKTIATLQESALMELIESDLKAAWAPLLGATVVDFVKAKGDVEIEVQRFQDRSRAERQVMKKEDDSWFPVNISAEVATRRLAFLISAQQIAFMVEVIPMHERIHALAKEWDARLAAAKERMRK